LKNYLTILALLICEISFGQNLIPNPNFEDTIYCPTSANQVVALQYWQPLADSPDYFTPNGCGSLASTINVPDNFVGYQNALSGNGYVGMVCFFSFPNSREYVTTQLTDSLIVGQKYFVTMHISLSGGLLCTLGCNKFGCKLSTLPFPFSTTPHNDAQFYSDSIITDTLNWILIKGSFIADSVYKYIAFGNFFDDVHTDTSGFGPFPGQSYYYLDDVCLSIDSLSCNSTTGINQSKKENEIKIFPNPFKDELTFVTNSNSVLEVTIYDVLSNKLLRQEISGTTILNTEQFKGGFYIYDIRNRNGTITKGKLIKQ
jgi:hypothetical protein